MTDNGFTRLAVNGTLMRGLELNANMLRAGAVFVREERTAPCYRLWTVGDRHPAMLRMTNGGAAVQLELWDVPGAGVVEILESEPPGLAVGKVELADGTQVLGVLGEPYIVEGELEITDFASWRSYIAAKATKD